VMRQKILNSVCCVPNLSSGYSPYQLKNGSYKETGGDSEQEIALSRVTFGKLENKPVAVALLGNWTGGSGIFMSLLLYDLRGATPVEVASYAVGDRTDVRSLSIRPDGVYMTCVGFRGDQSLKLRSIVVKRKDFDVAECITHPLSTAERQDLDDLMAIWI